MEFRILGPLQVVDGDVPVEIAGVKRRAVLALLVLRANEIVRSEWLIEELWGDQAPRNAAAALQNHVSRLRKALGPDILARREWGYVLRAAPETIDLHRFEELLLEAEPLPARERSAKLAEALSIWRGPPLADLSLEPSLQRDIARLEELRLTTLERRIDADLEAGRNAELVGELEALIAEHPLREHLRSQLILALYRADRQAEALEVYRETRRVLAEELGLDPSPTLRELERAILRHDPSLAGVPPTEEPAAPPGRRVGAPLIAAALVATGAVAGGTAFALTRGGGNDARQAAATEAQRVVTETVVRNVQTVRHRLPAPPQSHPPKTAVKHSVPRPKRPVVRRPTHSRVAVATTTTTTTTIKRGTPRKPPKPVTISDNFSGTEVDDTIWYQIPDGTGWTLTQRDGYVEYDFPPTSTPGGEWNQFGGQLGMQCKWPGDFDARVDYSLPQWPARNSISVNLWAFFPGSGWAIARQSTGQWGELYTSFMGSGASGGVQLDDRSGALRLVRKNGVVKSYFLHKGAWQELMSARNNRTATIALAADGSSTATWDGQSAVVDLSSFTITGDDPVCPPGSQPGG